MRTWSTVGAAIVTLAIAGCGSASPPGRSPADPSQTATSTPGPSTTAEAASWLVDEYISRASIREICDAVAKGPEFEVFARRIATKGVEDKVVDGITVTPDDIFDATLERC